MIPLRGPRLLILLAAVLIAITLYTFYPQDPFRTPHSPEEAYDHYEAGGIDSDHYNAPIIPKFDEEGCDGPDGTCLPDHVGEGRTIMDEEMRSENDADDSYGQQQPIGMSAGAHNPGGVSEDILSGGVIMPKLENATAKAELGRAAWRVMHLMTLRYPENPTPEDRTALKSYFHLFSRLYPCGECAEEFQKLLKEYPPQTSSRKTASMWLCSVHNMVNERLGKPEFDCLTLNDVYDCGCEPEGEDGAKGGAEGRGGGDNHESGVGASAGSAKSAPPTTSNANDEDDDADDDENETKLDVDEAEDEKNKLKDALEGQEPNMSQQQHKQLGPESEADAREAADEDEDEDDDEDDDTEEEEQQFRILPVPGVIGDGEVKLNEETDE